MTGAGSIQFITSSYTLNRSLLKRKSSDRYKNFDTSYITDYPISKKKRPSSFPTASPSYMRVLKKQLLADRTKALRKNKILFILSLAMIAIIAILLFSIHF